MKPLTPRIRIFFMSVTPVTGSSVSERSPKRAMERLGAADALAVEFELQQLAALPSPHSA